MKQLIACSLFFISMIHAAIAQKNTPFYADIGASVIAPWNYTSRPATFLALTLTPGIKVTRARNFAVVINVPVSVGWRFKGDGYLGIDLPAMLNLHFGSAAGHTENSRWGIIVGAGAAYVNVVKYYYESGNIKNRAEFWGYRFNLAVSFNTDKEGDDLMTPALFLNYGSGISDGRAHIFSIGLRLIMNITKKVSYGVNTGTQNQ